MFNTEELTRKEKQETLDKLILEYQYEAEMSLYPTFICVSYEGIITADSDVDRFPELKDMVNAVGLELSETHKPNDAWVLNRLTRKLKAEFRLNKLIELKQKLKLWSSTK